MDNIGLLFLIVAAPFISSTYVSLVERRHWGYLKSDTKTFKKDDGFEMYIVMLLNLIENKGNRATFELKIVDDPVSRIKLEGVLKFHVKSCTKSESACTCSLLVQELRNYISSFLNNNDSEGR